MAAAKIDYALAYAKKLPGRLLPVVKMGKKPVFAGWQENASNDPVMLHQWFQHGANLGWQPNADTIVLDVDKKADEKGINGFGTLAQMTNRHGALPDTLSATTPTGGKHYVFRLPAGVKGKNIVGGNLKPPVSGLDVRTTGGQIVIEPSEREEGCYKWDNWDVLNEPPPAIADAPAWLVAFATGGGLTGKAQKPKTETRVGSGVMVIGEGKRNAALVTEAGRLRRVGYEYPALVGALQALNESQFNPPVPLSEVEAVARWVCEGHEPTEDATLADQQSGDDWRGEIEGANGITEVVEIVRRLHLDAGLSKSEQHGLVKAAAKQVGVPVKTLLADVRDNTDGDSRPVINVKQHDFAGTVDAVMGVLPGIENLRQRSGDLVEVVRGDLGSKLGAVPLARLVYLTAQAARWQYGDTAGSPDVGALQAVLAAGVWPGVPEIAGLLHQPTVDLKTGDVVIGRGYVPSLRREAVFDPEIFPAYDGDDAIAQLRALLAGFTFATARDESGALAGILTAAIRPVLPTAPAFLISASDYGSGKSYLSRLIAAFAGGGSMQRWPGRDDDQSKVLLSLLLEGRQAVIFDNLSKDWKSDTMAAILTDPVFSDRQLGASKTPELSTCCMWITNGVNIAPAADLQRRVITIGLDARCEKPWERTFDCDPLAEVEAERGKWLGIALRAVSDFLKSGHAPALASLGSFTEWTRVIRGAVVAAGLPDPVQALGANVADDEERELLARFLYHWQHSRFFGEARTARALVAEVNDLGGDSHEAGLRYVLEDIAKERGEINLRKVGNWLRGSKGRIVDGLRLVSPGTKGEHGVLWSVQAI